MKIFFSASIHVGVDRKIYKRIVKVLEDLGHKVIYDHVLISTKDKIDVLTVKERVEYHRKMSKTIASCDMSVCEVSFPSTISIGHEVTLALDKGKPVVALYQKEKEPGVLQGIKSDRFILVEYSKNDLKEVIEYGIDEASEKIDVRFNFFISPKINRFLDVIAKNKRIPRAVYLRRLIEKDMKKNKDYEG